MRITKINRYFLANNPFSRALLNNVLRGNAIGGLRTGLKHLADDVMIRVVIGISRHGPLCAYAGKVEVISRICAFSRALRAMARPPNDHPTSRLSAEPPHRRGMPVHPWTQRHPPLDLTLSTAGLGKLHRRTRQVAPVDLTGSTDGLRHIHRLTRQRPPPDFRLRLQAQEPHRTQARWIRGGTRSGSTTGRGGFQW